MNLLQFRGEVLQISVGFRQRAGLRGVSELRARPPRPSPRAPPPPPRAPPTARAPGSREPGWRRAISLSPRGWVGSWRSSGRRGRGGRAPWRQLWRRRPVSAPRRGEGPPLLGGRGEHSCPPSFHAGRGSGMAGLIKKQILKHLSR